MSAGKTEEIKPAGRSSRQPRLPHRPRSPCHPRRRLVRGWEVRGLRTLCSPKRGGGDLEPWGVEEGCERQLPAPTPSSSCEWRATWDLSAKG